MPSNSPRTTRRLAGLAASGRWRRAAGTRLGAVFAAGAVGLVAVGNASDLSVLNSEGVTFTDVDSVGDLGNINNDTRSHLFAGGFLATHVEVEGTLTKVAPNTFSNETEIAITVGDGALTFSVSGSPTDRNLYDEVGADTVVSPPTFTKLGAPTAFAGNANMEFYESFFDDAPGADQIWDTVTIRFQEILVTNGSFPMGTLPPDGTQLLGPGQGGNAYHTNVFEGLDYFTFSLPEDMQTGGFLNIQTFDPGTGDSIDTELAIFDSTGLFIATNDQGQSAGLGDSYSVLSFGADPMSGDLEPGIHGDVLAAGVYTVVVGGFESNFAELTEESTVDDVEPGISSGDYSIGFAFRAMPIPEPGSLLFLGVCMLGIPRRRTDV